MDKNIKPKVMVTTSQGPVTLFTVQNSTNEALGGQMPQSSCSISEKTGDDELIYVKESVTASKKPSGKASILKKGGAGDSSAKK